MSKTLVGVDVGTTHVKAILFSPEDGVVHVARRPTLTHQLADGGAYYEPDELLGAVEAVLHECVDDAAPPAAIGIASMAESGVGLDARGRPIGEILAWFDPRPRREAAELETAFGAQRLFARTGLRAEPKYTLPKLLWLRRRRPAAFRRLSRWAGVAELAGFALTGNLATNASLACRTLAFDVAARRWDGELLALAGLDARQMPPLRRLGDPLGGVLPDVAARLGLAARTPVAIAGHDHLVGAIGAGVVEPGMGLDSMGSAEVALVVTGAPALSDDVRRLGFSSGCHAVDGASYVLGGLQSSGSLVEWFIDAFLGPGLDGPERYERFVALLADERAVPGELLVAPYLRGRTAPRRDAAASLEFAGLRAEHGLPDIAAAILDGAAFHVRWMFEELAAATGTAISTIRLTGGGTRNERWLAAKAALGPPRLEVVRTDEAVALGAALVAGLAAGTFGSIEEALAFAAPGTPLAASRSARDGYDAAYRERWLPWILGPRPDSRR